MATLVGIVLILVGLWIRACTETPPKQDYTNHHCYRDCLNSESRVCEYDFTLEHYITLSYACYDCPRNVTDCFRPHCVPGDGRRRAIKVVNRQMPGPAIHVCQGDVVKVNVYNQLGDFEGTSIHWHGILQEKSPHMDGVAMLTQCPIPRGSMFQYKFKTTNPGTHFWHAHTGFQRGDGVFGALIVRENSRTRVMAEYEHDLADHTILVQDWLDQFTASKFALHHHGMDDNAPSSILINGKGTSRQAAVGMVHGNSTDTGHNPGAMADSDMDRHMADMAEVPHTVFRVTKQNRYRFRLISNGILNCPLKVSIENHTLTVIASDGHETDAANVNSITIYAGERYDFVLYAGQEVGNYWIHVAGLGDCSEKQTYETAILRYDGEIDDMPTSPRSYAIGTNDGKDSNSLSTTPLNVAQMTSPYEHNDGVLAAPESRITKFYLTMDFNKVSNPLFLHPSYYPLDQLMATMMEHGASEHSIHLFALQMNHITNVLPYAPPLTQYSDLNEDMFCNEETVMKNCKAEFCDCIHRIKVEINEIVELILVTEAKHGQGHHPMHLHGHSFYVLGMEKLNTSTTREEVEAHDVGGRLQRNLNNPIKKDTVVVPDGGYTIVRFKASNLGFWLFHCHVEFHTSLGLALVIQVGETSEMPKPPDNFPRCGNWSFTDEGTQYIDLYTSGFYNLQSLTGHYLICFFIFKVIRHIFFFSNLQTY